ncbi:MAG: thiamine phosphate synthase [Sandaracinaceae bacterium]
MPGLYAIVDPERLGDRDPARFAEAVLDGGCARLQLRMKRGADRTFLALARRIAELCARREVRFVVNDRPDLARLAGAGGLHLGQDDLDPLDARAIVGEGVEIGLSTHDERQVELARNVDLLAFGPVFDTASKDAPDPTVGLERLAAICRGREVVAIGGIDLARAPQVRAAGATYGAVIGALAQADDPRAMAAALHAALGGAA